MVIQILDVVVLQNQLDELVDDVEMKVKVKEKKLDDVFEMDDNKNDVVVVVDENAMMMMIMDLNDVYE